jgi:protein archease
MPNQSNPNTGFWEIEHTADIALKVRGRNMNEFFVNAAKGITSLMAGEQSVECFVECSIEKQLELKAIDIETLLVDWLSEFCYWAESEALLFKEIQINQISHNSLKATLIGSQVTSIAKLVKAVTYHNLNINQTENGYETTITFDV